MAKALILPVRALARLVPAPLRARLEDRVFYAVFQMTRVTNDAYPGTAPPPGPAGGGPTDSRSGPAAG